MPARYRTNCRASLDADPPTPSRHGVQRRTRRRIRGRPRIGRLPSQRWKPRLRSRDQTPKVRRTAAPPPLQGHCQPHNTIAHRSRPQGYWALGVDTRPAAPLQAPASPLAPALGRSHPVSPHAAPHRERRERPLHSIRFWNCDSATAAYRWRARTAGKGSRLNSKASSKASSKGSSSKKKKKKGGNGPTKGSGKKGNGDEEEDEGPPPEPMQVREFFHLGPSQSMPQLRTPMRIDMPGVGVVMAVTRWN